MKFLKKRQILAQLEKHGEECDISITLAKVCNLRKDAYGRFLYVISEILHKKGGQSLFC
jgi:hypothetical protein